MLTFSLCLLLILLHKIQNCWLALLVTSILHDVNAIASDSSDGGDASFTDGNVLS